MENNTIRVRVREAKSGGEDNRYTLEKCAVEAKFIREKDPNETDQLTKKWDTFAQNVEQPSPSPDGERHKTMEIENKVSKDKAADMLATEQTNEDSSSESDDSFMGASPNPFSALM